MKRTETLEDNNFMVHLNWVGHQRGAPSTTRPRLRAGKCLIIWGFSSAKLRKREFSFTGCAHGAVGARSGRKSGRKSGGGAAIPPCRNRSARPQRRPSPARAGPAPARAGRSLEALKFKPAHTDERRCAKLR